MSHLCEIEREFRDLDSLRAALAELGLELGGPGVVEYFYGRHGGESRSDRDLERCDHIVQIPESSYSLGFKRQANGSYKPVCDEELLEGGYGQRDKGREILGEKGGKLWQAYAYHGAVSQAHRKGYSVMRQYEKDGSVKIRVKAR